MTYPKTLAPRLAGVPAAALAALLLAGCAATHVGDEWQCPLPKGGSCGSVAEADPAVPAPAAAGNTVLRGPLWRPRPERAPGAPPGTVRSCEAECGGGFDPFGWLARLFQAGDDGGSEVRPAATGAGPATAAAAPPGASPSGSADPETAPPSSTPSPAQTKPRSAEPAAAALPAGPGPSQDEPARDDLRTGEVIARIWIAPFVDADGVYREASHVRVVLEPAGWRLP